MKVSLLAALALLMTATVATAQHQHTTPNVIDVDGNDSSRSLTFKR
jgi:hypothetical protein